MKFLYFICLFSIHICFSQSTLDIKNNGHSIRNKRLLSQIYNNPFVLYSTPCMDYTRVSINGNFKNNNEKNTLKATGEQDLKIAVEGVFKHKNTYFLGSINFKRSNLKGLGWNLSNMLPYKNSTEKSPYYYLAYKEGTWKNQSYYLDGTMLNVLVEKKLHSIVRVGYKTLKDYRTLEPLPELTYLDMNLTGGISYTLTPSSSVNISANYGRINNKIGIGYTGSSANKNIPFNTEIYNRISVGFGFIESAKTPSAKEEEQYKGFKIGYGLHRKNKNLNLDFSFKTSNNAFIERYTDSYYKELGYYTVNTYKLNGFYTIDTQNKKQLFTTNFAYFKGSNFRHIFNGTNYKSSFLKIQGSYVFSKYKNQHVDYEFSGSIAFKKTAQKDYQVGANQRRSTLKIGITTLKEFPISQHTSIGANISMGHQFSLHHNIGYTTNTHARFVKDVLKADYRYFTSNSFFLKPTVGIHFIHQKQHINTGIYYETIHFYGGSSKYTTETDTNSNAGIFIKFTN